jgi:hypothetical protein
MLKPGSGNFSLLEGEHITNDIVASFTQKFRRYRKSLPIRIRRPAMTCSRDLESRKSNSLVLIPFASRLRRTQALREVGP